MLHRYDRVLKGQIEPRHESMSANYVALVCEKRLKLFPVAVFRIFSFK